VPTKMSARVPSSSLEQTFGELVFNQGQGPSSGSELPRFPVPRDRQGVYSMMAPPELAPSAYSYAPGSGDGNSRILEARTDPALLVPGEDERRVEECAGCAQLVAATF
jgi:hypothetical protein